MAKFVVIYPYEVIDAIRDEHDVRMLDRKSRIVHDPSVMTAYELFSILNAAAVDKTNRYEFWEVVKEENEDGNDTV